MDERAQIFAAIAAAQGEMEQPNKDREVEVQMKKQDGSNGGKYKFKYATLDNIISTIRPALAAHGLGFMQLIREGEMVTRILHTSGQFVDCNIPMPSLPANPQQAGAAISYFKRYSLCAALGIVADEDDEKNVVIENDALPGPAWPDGPYTSKSGLKAAWKAMVHDLHGAASLHDVEAIIDREKDMLAQFRAAARNGVDDLKDQYQGRGDFVGVADELMNARSRFAGTQDVPREPGRPAGMPDEEMAETTKVVLTLVDLCRTQKDFDDLAANNKPLLDAASDGDKQAIREAIAARKAALRSNRNQTAAG